MVNYNDINKIALILKQRYPSTIPKSDYDWKNPSLNIIDCVLSLNRRYCAFVIPRLKSFKKNNPDCFLIEDLIKIFQSHKNDFGVFTNKELDYNHPDRGRIIYEVAQSLKKEISKDSNGEQIEKLKRWAINAKPEEVFSIGIKGFGLSGYQYLRMLMGAQTAKPDVHIKNYLSQILSKNLSDIQALNLLEKAAMIIDLPLRDLDYDIWKLQSGSH